MTQTYRLPRLACWLLLGALVSALPSLARAEVLGVERWKVERPALQIAGVLGTQLFGRDGDELLALDLTSGKKRWSTRIGNLLSGPRTLAVDENGVYALGTTGLYVLAPSSGAIMHTAPLDKPLEIVRAGKSLYVAYEKGVVRLASGGKKRLASSERFQGRVQGAEGNVVLLFRVLPRKGKRGSPQRLTAVDLKKGRKVYEFRLLPTGDHRVIGMGAGKLSFIDFSKNLGGKNPHKLFLTEVDYRKNKKLHDIALKHHYFDPKSDRFFALPAGPGAVLLVQNGPLDATSSVLVLDLKQKQVRWQHKAKEPFGAPVIRGQRVWLACGRGKARHLVAYGLADGKEQARTAALSASEVGAPQPVGDKALVVRTKAGLRCLQPGAPVAASRPAAADPTRGWRLYRDTLAGYTIKLPSAWKLNPRHVRHFGPNAFAVPFVRYQVKGDRWLFQASVHVLVRPSRGQTAEQVWKAVLAQRGRRTPVKIVGTQRRKRNGLDEVFGSYSFRNRYGRQETAQSLCVVSHGLAFELRARVRPAAAAQLASELRQIFETFTVRPELRKKR